MLSLIAPEQAWETACVRGKHHSGASSPELLGKLSLTSQSLGLWMCKMGRLTVISSWGCCGDPLPSMMQGKCQVQCWSPSVTFARN